MINKKRLLKLTRDLIAIKSENPPGNESVIADFVKRYLQNIGLSPEVCEFRKNRTNVIAVLPGTRNSIPAGKAGLSLLITPHLDTVPAGKNWIYPPFAGRVVKGKLYGLGSTDCKCNLACSLEVMQSLIEDRITLGYNIIMAATADEESGSGLGLIPLLDKGIVKPNAALVLDADDFDIVVAQKGLIHLKIIIHGKRAHGAYPWMGVNAIDLMSGVLSDVKAWKFAYKENQYLRPPTVNFGTIRGGDKVNVVADWCECELDFRFLPGTRATDILAALRKIIAARTKNFELEIQGIQQPYQISEKHPLVIGLQDAARQCGVRSRVKGSEGATVITFFQHKGIPAVATGAGCSGQAHCINEYVSVENLYKGAMILETFLRKYKFES